VQDVTTEHAGPILRLRGIGRRFGGLDAVRDVDLDVAHGERRAILGPNGAGKTTLFNVISGDMPQTAGTIEFLGQDIGRIPAPGRTRLGMGRTYQKSRLFLGLTVEDNLYLAVLGTRKGHLRLRRAKADGDRDRLVVVQQQGRHRAPSAEPIPAGRPGQRAWPRSSGHRAAAGRRLRC